MTTTSGRRVPIISSACERSVWATGITESTDFARAFHASSSGWEPMNNVQGCDVPVDATFMFVIRLQKLARRSPDDRFHRNPVTGRRLPRTDTPAHEPECGNSQRQSGVV